MSKTEIPLNERIIFALDVPTPGEAIQLVDRLDDHINYFKVGLQLFFAGGWPVIEYIAERGNKVMLDLKLYDIPATVRLAVEQFANRGVTMTTVHGYSPVVEAALAAKTDITILAVTVLTSFGDEHRRELGCTGTIDQLVLQRAETVLEHGCHGIVCSAGEALMLRGALGDGFTMVTPGIRPADTGVDDQKRVTTPGRAVRDGSDYLVIGRPIRDAADPRKMVDGIQQEIQKALSL